MTDREFLKDRDHTGRFIVVGPSGKKYYVEPIGNPRTAFGDVNPATGKVEGSYESKYKGSISENESLIIAENGFDDPILLGPGESPLSYIQRLEQATAK